MIGTADGKQASRPSGRWWNDLSDPFRNIPLVSTRDGTGSGDPPELLMDPPTAMTMWEPCSRDYRQVGERSFLVIGTPGDRKGFTTAIRAFALAGRRGDRLTISGYGPYRARLEKWTVALSIECKVSFADARPCSGQSEAIGSHDVAIILSRNADAFDACRHALLAGRAVLAPDRNEALAMLLAESGSGMVFPSGDVTALSLAMLRVAPRR